MNKYYKLYIVVFLVFLVIGCNKENINIIKNQLPIVGVITLNMASIPVSNEYIGVAEGSEVVEIRPQVSGILRSREYKEGTFIRKGQLLFVIEPDSYEAILNEARGNLNQAEAKYIQSKDNYNRILSLYKKNAISRKDLDNAKGEYDAAKALVESNIAAYNNAKIKLEYTYIRSPISGYIGKANFSVGNLVNSNSILTTINNINPIYINFYIPDSEISLLKRLQSLSMIKFEDIYVEVFYSDNIKFKNKGKIIFIDKTINKDTGNIYVKAEFSNENYKVIPGQFIKTKVAGAKLINTLLIPQEAILYTANGNMAIIINENNVAQYTKIELGPNINGKFIVLNGLEAGQRIVVEGVNKVKGGSKVMPTAPENMKNR